MSPRRRWLFTLVLSVAAGCGKSGAPLQSGNPGAGGATAGAGGSDAASGSSAGGGGAAGSATDAGGGGDGSAGYPTSCDDLGPEPTIPPACATVLATKTETGGVLADESTLDTAQIQAAIDACPSGQAVKLAASGASNALLSAPLYLRDDVTLWVDAGVTLFASRTPSDFDARPGQCGGNGTGNASCYGLVNANGVANAGVVGSGTLDGRGGEVVNGGTSTWWQLETADNGSLAAPRLIQITGSQNFTLYQINLHNSPKFHVSIQTTNGFKIWGIEINTPPTAPNTDGIDPAASTNGVIAYSKITTGDDDIAIKGSGPPAVDNIIIAHNHFGRGHGMSIGSETYGGVQNVKVCDLSIDNAQNGLRIKSDSSRGGLVQNISYTDVCMRKVTNPLVFDPYYSTATGTQIPDYQGISVTNLHVLGGGTLTVEGYDAAHLLTLSLDNVVFDSAPTGITASAANVMVGPDPVSITTALAGAGATVTGAATGTTAPRDCTNAFVTF